MFPFTKKYMRMKVGRCFRRSSSYYISYSLIFGKLVCLSRTFWINSMLYSSSIRDSCMELNYCRGKRYGRSAGKDDPSDWHGFNIKISKLICDVHVRAIDKKLDFLYLRNCKQYILQRGL